MNESELIEKIDQRIEELIQKVEDEEGPRRLIEKLSRSNPEAFTKAKEGSRDDLTEEFPEWGEELFSMYNDIDRYVEEFKLTIKEEEF